MEKKCCNCGKLYEEGKVLNMKVEKVFEGKEYTWEYCSLECVMNYKGDEILDKINSKQKERLSNFLEGQKIRLDHPKFKL